MMLIELSAAGLLLAILFILSLRGGKLVKKRPSVPAFGYKLFYSDQKSAERAENVIYSKLLVSNEYQLSGKPDFIYKRNGTGMLLPVELKSGSIGAASRPHEGDLMQLAAYFIIIEDIYGIRPKRGRLIYKDCMFVVRNTGSLRRKVLAVLRQMREVLETGKIPPEYDSSPSFIKCRHCMCRGTVCEE